MQKKIQLIKFIICLVLLSKTGFAQQYPLTEKIKQIQNLQIDISSLTGFLNTLTLDEQSQQISDWAVFSLLARMDTPQVKISEALGASSPMRYPYLKTQVKNEIATGRIKYLSNREAVILLPEQSLNDKDIISCLLDMKYAQANIKPEHIHIFGFRLENGNNIISVSYDRTITSASAFSPEYNYFKQEVKNLADFNKIIQSIDDVTFLQWTGKSITIGGRKYPSQQNRSLAVEDLAVLYEAYNERITPASEEKNKHDYNIFINSKYDEVLKTNSRLRRALQAGKIKRSQILEEIRRQIPYVSLASRDPNVGFSLDTDFDYSAIYDDLVKVSTKDASFIDIHNAELANLIDSNNSQIISTAEQIKAQNNIEPLLSLMRKYDESNGIKKYFSDLLRHIETKNSFQFARYDGPLQGSSPAMVLFYTDLTAKLWALDYNNSSPKSSITGFRTMAGIKVPKLYWDDFIRLSKTRLWFGLRQESFEFYGNKLLFEPVATRVYAASSNPLFPGKESTPNFQSAEFLGWWDLHYQAVADYEPQFHKLNQIQKWSSILVILREEKNHVLDFLFNVPVQKPFDFEQWYKNTDYLKSKPAVSFLDRQKHNKKTECLPLLYSRDYPLMGQSFYLFGGVSLASKKDILQKLNRKAAATAPGNKPLAAAGKGIAGKPATVATVKPGETKPKIKQAVLVTQEPNKLKLKCKVDNIDYGNLNLNKNGNTITLTWEKNYGVILNDFLSELVQLQQSRQQGYKDESIFTYLSGIESVIRVENWKVYLAKISSIKNKWVYLGINDNSKTSSYQAKDAGTEPYSDIFSAKTISEEQFNKLLKEKQTIKVF